MTVGSNTLYFAYDASGTPMSVTYNGTNYYYATNVQGDVTAILNTSGTAVVEYTYDAWGNPLTTTGTMAETLGAVNPLRYRGYVYDTETSLYYLQSRYYDPELGRFINADAYASTGQGILGNNMFAYCNNNPVNGYDPCGTCIHNWKFYNCEKCDEFWNGVGKWCVDAYNSINEFHQQQAQLEAEMRMLQYEMVANTAKAIGDAYMQGYNMQQEAQLREAELIAQVSPRIREAGRVGGKGALIYVLVETGILYLADKTAPKITLISIGATYAAGYVVGVYEEIVEIIKENL